MYYYLYKITNLLNNKYYIGMHQTKDLNDGYMGSGKIIKSAIKKYGIENFKKEILEFFINDEEMKKGEKKIIDTKILDDPLCYNLRLGGRGGFDYINKNGLAHNNEINLKRSKKIKLWHLENDRKGKNSTFYGKKHTEETKKKQSTLKKEYFKNGGVHPQGMMGKKHTEETKKKQSKNNAKTLLGKKGNLHPCTNTKWYNNGIKSIRSKTRPKGSEWVEGRIINKTRKQEIFK